MRIGCREFPSCRRFGVELEVAANISKQDIAKELIFFERHQGANREVKCTPGEKGWAETCRNSYWHVKYDSTCGFLGKNKDHGWEVASFIASGADDLDSIANASAYLSSRNVVTTCNAGLHVHVDVQDIDMWRMGCLLARWIKVEWLMMAICPRRRWNNRYCRSLLTRSEILGVNYSKTNPADFCFGLSPKNYATHDNDEKKYTLNILGWYIGRIVPDYARQTIELRLPECSLDREHITNWVTIFMNFVDRETSPPNDLSLAGSVAESLELLSLQGNQEFLILDQKILNAKLWFLRKIKNSDAVGTRWREEARKLEKACILS